MRKDLNPAHISESIQDLILVCNMMLERLKDEQVARLWESPEEHEQEMQIYINMIEKAVRGLK